jgi:hypothetical protein
VELALSGGTVCRNRLKKITGPRCARTPATPRVLAALLAAPRRRLMAFHHRAFPDATSYRACRFDEHHRTRTRSGPVASEWTLRDPTPLHVVLVRGGGVTALRLARSRIPSWVTVEPYLSGISARAPRSLNGGGGQWFVQALRYGRSVASVGDNDRVLVVLRQGAHLAAERVQAVQNEAVHRWLTRRPYGR